MNTKYKFALWLALAILIPIMMLLDLFLSTIYPTGGSGSGTQFFDISMINQTIFLTDWAAIVTAFWAICNLIHLKNKKMPHWIIGKNFFTFIVAINLLVFFIYNFILITTPSGIVEFDTWYKIAKGVIVHFTAAPIITIFYFLTIHDYESTKQYASKDGFWTIIFTAAYVIYIAIRCVMIKEFDPRFSDGDSSNDDLYYTFPYFQIDPYKQLTILVVLGSIAFQFIPYGIGCLLNYCSNLSAKSLVNKFESGNHFWPREDHWALYLNRK